MKVAEFVSLVVRLRSSGGVAEFRQITVLPHGEIFEITAQPARLKIEI